MKLRHLVLAGAAALTAVLAASLGMASADEGGTKGEKSRSDAARAEDGETGVRDRGASSGQDNPGNKSGARDSGRKKGQDKGKKGQDTGKKKGQDKGKKGQDKGAKGKGPNADKGNKGQGPNADKGKKGGDTNSPTGPGR
jgi:hypothetical protein